MQNIQKIGLIELANHNEVLRSYLVMLLERANTEIHVFTSVWNYEQCYDLQNNEKINWIIKKDESSKVFLRKQSSFLHGMDIIVQTTYEDSEGDLCLPITSVPLALVIHDLHTSLRASKHIRINHGFPEIVKELGRVIKFLLFSKPKLDSGLKTADYLLLPSRSVLEYAKANIKDDDRFLHLPFTINDEISTTNSGKEIQVTVPGTISDKSRDYMMLYDAIAELPKSTMFKLTLLGKPVGSYGNRIISLFSKLDNVNLVYFSDFILQSEFDKVMRSSDFLILPMKKIMKFGIIGEKNGFSCVSGNMNDFVRYGIPAILPKFYPLMEELKEVAWQYSSTIELREGIATWIRDRTFNSLKGNTMKVALKMYSKKRIVSLFDQNFASKNTKKL